MNKILSIIFFIYTFPVIAQVPVIEWQKCFGGTNYDDGWCVTKTFDGGYFLLGNTRSNDGDINGYHGGSDLWFVKIDSTGILQWEKSLGGNDDEFGALAIQTSDGGYLISQTTYSNNGDVNGNHGSADTWLVKLNSSGAILWQRCYGGSNFDGAPYGLIERNSNSFIICTNTYSNDFDVSGNHGINTSDIWIFEIDSDGTLLSQKCIGGSQDEYEADLLMQSNGNYLLIGQVLSTDGDITTGSHGGVDFWISELDSNNGIIWQRNYGGSDDEFARSAKKTRDGGFVIGGSTASNDFDVSGNHSLFSSQDYWLIKVDSIGNLQWQKCLGGAHWEDAFSIDTTDIGGILIAGESESEDGDITSAVDTLSSNWWIVNLDSAGTILWDKSMGGTGQDEAQSIYSTPDGGCIILGFTNSNDLDVAGGGYHGGQDFWAVKLSNPNVGITTIENFISDFFPCLNPATNILNLNFYSRIIGNASVHLLDITGRVLLQQSLEVTTGLNKKEIQINHLANGIYLVKLTTQDGSVTKKVVKN